MIPEETIKEKETRRRNEESYEAKALERIVADVRDDPDATATEKRLASALIALKNS